MIDFLLKSGLSMIILLAVYHLFLEKEKMHRFNRYYLLSALAFSLALPLITIPVYVEAPQEAPQAMMIVEDSGTLPQEFTTHTTFKHVQHPAPMAAKEPVIAPKINYLPFIAWGTYLLITLFLAIRFGVNISRFYKLKQQHNTAYYKGTTLILLDNDVLPHTFLNNIFISKEDYENRLIEPELFTHELVHVKQRHTLDILFIEMLKTVLWFNPLLYLYKRAIQLNHEFLADETTINQHLNITSYQQLLLQKAMPAIVYPLASSINFSITKKRFIMMTKTTNKTKSLLLKFAVLPVMAGLLYFLSTETVIYAKERANAPATMPGLKITNRVPELAPTTKIPTDEAITEQTVKDTVAGDARRDEYYKGVKIIIEDKINGVFVTTPYEKLTTSQKRYYLQTTPQKKRASEVGVSQEDYDYTLKTENTIFYIDDKKISKEDFLKYKKEDFAYFGARNFGISVKDGKVDMGTHQAFFYTPSFYKKNIKPINDHYPAKTCKITITDVPVDTALLDHQAKNKSGKSDFDWDNEQAEKAIKADTYPYAKQIKKNAIDISPEFPGGEKKFQEYMDDNLKIANKLEDKQLLIFFTINTDGSISDVMVNEEKDPEILADVKRVLEKSPRWIPAQMNGKAQKVTTSQRFPKKDN